MATEYFLNCSTAAASSPNECLNICQCSPLVRNATGGDGIVDYQQNVAAAFLMVTGAGLSTTFGAALVFCNRCVTRTNHAILGAALGFSSGVMLYVSFVEIAQKSLLSFGSCNCLWATQDPANAAYTAATLCFFGGVVIVYILDFLVHLVSSHGHGHSHGPETLVDSSEEQHHQNVSDPLPRVQEESSTRTSAVAQGHSADDFAIEDDGSSGDEENKEALDDPERYLDLTLSRKVGENSEKEGMDNESLFDIEKQMSRRMQEQDEGEMRPKQKQRKVRFQPSFLDPAGAPNVSVQHTFEEEAVDHGHGHTHGHHHETKLNDEELAARLNHMGLMTALAIGLHNFPEGLATFVAGLSNPRVGAALAVAIAIHNIPEGLCVSIPIYYATGSRWKAFWVAFFSGVTEIIGAALGYGFLMAIMGPAAYAVLFGLVAGMMVTIVVKELLPTAHRYDPQDRIVTKSIFIGMVVMALSLVLFRL